VDRSTELVPQRFCLLRLTHPLHPKISLINRIRKLFLLSLPLGGYQMSTLHQLPELNQQERVFLAALLNLNLPKS
jgi:hypothetical protein